MKKIVFTDDNGTLKLIADKFSEASYLPFDMGYDNDCEPDGIMVGHISSLKNAEKIKKYIISKKINGAFILVNLDLGKNGELFSFADKDMVKKMKELCLFADAIFINYTEACAFANLKYAEECEKIMIEGLIFKLNSFGMANKLIITSVPIEDRGYKTVISEYGECEILENNCVSEEKYLPAALVLDKILSGKKVKSAVSEALKLLYK